MRLAPLVSVLAAIWAIAPSAANAANGTFTQYLCFNPDTGQGVGAPPEISHAGGAPFPHYEPDCSGIASSSKGLVLRTGLPSTTSQGATGEITYMAPSGVTIASGHVFRALRAVSGNAHRLTLSQHGGNSMDFFGNPRGETFQWYTQTFVDTGSTANPFAAGNRLDLATGNAKFWRYTGGCDAIQCVADAGSVSLRIFGGKLTLADGTDPQGSATGALATDSVLSGLAEVLVSASDTGSGVYRVQIFADGGLVADDPFDGNNGKCSDVAPGNADRYEFASASPCKPASARTSMVDTRLLADGRHTIRVDVEDAAGNRTPILSRTVLVDNVPDSAVAGSPPSSSSHVLAPAVRVPVSLTFGVSRRRLANGQMLKYFGALKGTDVGHKFVEVQVRQGRTWRVVCSVRTDLSGAFACRYRFRRTFKRTGYRFRARVRPQVGIDGSAATATTTVVVRPRR